mgnify:CR=1 FL=1
MLLAHAALDFARGASHMQVMRCALLFLPLLLAGCGEAIRDDHFTNDVAEERAAPSLPQMPPQAVRVGELGPSFPACNAVGTTRNVAAGAALPVHAAPFDNAAETGGVPAGTRFFICSRSIDQKWFGIVYDDAGASRACGVSQPLPRRRDYDGPCRSGWVASPLVKFVSGMDAPAVDSAPAPAPAP